jgi:NAD(P)-dependent dehydrogenase (short-subunit alcohol dehydrogenase family)
VRDSGGAAIFIKTDVTREDSVRNLIQQTIKQFGQLDILYNCAGGSIVEDKPVTEVDMFVWQHTTSLDLLGTFNCCRHAISQLIKAGGGCDREYVFSCGPARISGARLRCCQRRHHFIDAGTGRRVWEKSGIRANAICPALVKTDRVLQRFGDPR